MPGRITELSESQIVADALAELRRLRRALAASQLPVWTENTFTAPATYQLTYIPYGINALADNGTVLSEGTDYTVNYSTGLITFTVGRTAGHVIYVSYVTTGDLTALSGPVDTGGLIDTFNRANSTSTINPASDGGTWTDERNAWGISGNNAYVHGDSGAGNLWDFSGMVIHRDLGSTVQTVQVDVNRTAGGNNSRIYWSLSTGSPGSAYVLIWNVGNDFHLYKSHSNGTATSLTGPFGTFGLLGAWHTIKVTYDGAGTSSFYVDGASTPFQTYTDSSPLTGTRVGIGQYQADSGTNYLYDNFSASQS